MLTGPWAVKILLQQIYKEYQQVVVLFVCVEALRPSQAIWVMSSAVSYLTTLSLGRTGSGGIIQAHLHLFLFSSPQDELL